MTCVFFLGAVGERTGAESAEQSICIHQVTTNKLKQDDEVAPCLQDA